MLLALLFIYRVCEVCRDYTILGGMWVRLPEDELHPIDIWCKCHEEVLTPAAGCVDSVLLWFLMQDASVDSRRVILTPRCVKSGRVILTPRSEVLHSYHSEVLTPAPGCDVSVVI